MRSSMQMGRIQQRRLLMCC
ncbi:hypothetical protein LINPERPRIM_LOCUS17399 [Linum perenne]